MAEQVKMIFVVMENEKMDDYISRQKLLKDIEKYHLSDGKFQYWVEVQPSADVQAVKRGHWIPKFNGEFRGGAYWYDCSECGHTVAGGILSGNNFCRNCGADMRGEK